MLPPNARISKSADYALQRMSLPKRGGTFLEESSSDVTGVAIRDNIFTIVDLHSMLRVKFLAV